MTKGVDGLVLTADLPEIRSVRCRLCGQGFCVTGINDRYQSLQIRFSQKLLLNLYLILNLEVNMIIYHTTFHLSDEIYPEGLNYLKATYIPAVTRSGRLHSPKMQRVLNEEGGSGGVSLSVRFSVENMVILEEWMRKEGVRLQQEMAEKFRDQIAGFSTLLEVMEL
jgi:hypothetical protein